jgi:hypothetical protein
MSGSLRQFFRVSALSVLLIFAASAAQSQSQATCRFKLFQLNSSNTPGFQANGVNDYGTVVGQAFFSPAKGFIRFSGGGVSYFAAPNAATTASWHATMLELVSASIPHRAQLRTFQRALSCREKRSLPLYIPKQYGVRKSPR